MELNRLYSQILTIYQTYHITAFPVDCLSIARQCGLSIRRYSELTCQQRSACIRRSSDACLIDGVLFYEEETVPGRLLFSIARELGHFLLNIDPVDDADCFASHFLAPRILIHKYRCRDVNQIHDHFGLSYAASAHALQDYRTWYRHISLSARRPTDPELQLSLRFFPGSAAGESHLPCPAPKQLSARRLELQQELAERSAFIEQLYFERGSQRMYHSLESQWLYGHDL